jgi:hypothetical protein
MLPGEREVNRCCRLLRLVVAVHLWRPRPQEFTVLVLSASGYGLALDGDSAESTEVVIVRERTRDEKMGGKNGNMLGACL